MAERAEDFLVNEYKVDRPKAKEYVSGFFKHLDTITEEDKLEGLSDEEKSEIMISSVKTLSDYLSDIVKKLSS
jgi:hypothetical protein